MRSLVAALAFALVLTAGACGGAHRSRSPRVIDCTNGLPLGSPPTVAHPLACPRRTTLAHAAASAGAPLVLPKTTLVRASDVGRVWIDGFFRRKGHRTNGTVAVTFPAQGVIVEYTRPTPFNGQPRTHFQQMAQGLPGSKVVDLNGRAALVIRQDSDQTRHNFGVVIFKLNGNEVRVMGHNDQATLEALALSILDQSEGSRSST